VLDDVDDRAPERRLEQVGVGEQQRAGPDPMRGGRDEVLWILWLRHSTIMAPALGNVAHKGRYGANCRRCL